ncbi:MAG: Lrp/AsnC family transcriptional regulator [Candidatus Methanomethylicota archaeon]|uniref:Lrp/AsnC family transcriptional regulator n=1 Tax=Thermoproteota archaeon TaxID=2056631 RepID=A0A497ESI5_9CREN|nr:MAG: Lrp/AsnC family transcriptional regulator [Candidatus Verstraetearchaeota archaeon]RLE52259.1 MAG: Lrp/AsnC family transcriptional regulator [Candidatus Verstraetearchaeota archaeon]
MKNFKVLKLDDADKKLIRLLQQDGRATLLDLGRKLGISHVAVRKRFSKLEENKVFKVRAELNIKKLGFKAVLVFMEIEGPDVLDELRKKFERCPRIVMLSTLMGGYNMMAMMIAEDDSVLEGITSVCAIRRLKGIRRTEVYVLGEIFEPQYLPIKFSPEEKSAIPPCEAVDCSKCPRYSVDLCLGCPATTCYKGPL